MVISPDAHLARLPRISACFTLVSLFRSHITSGLPLFLLRKFKLVFLFNNHLAFFIIHSISNFISIISRRRTYKEFQLALASFASRISEEPTKKFSLLQLHLLIEFQDQTCQLAVGCKENIVATRTILEYRKPNVLVVIDMVLSPDAHLPIRTSELVYVSDGLGQHILWPEKLVSQAAVVNKMSKSAVKPSKGKLDVNAEVNTPMVSKSVIKPFKEKLEVNEEVNSPIVQQTFKKPHDIQAFDKMVKKVMKHGSQVKVDFEDTFSYKLHTYLTLEEIQDLIDMQELSQNCITVYMTYLCAETKARLINEKFGFIHPTTLSFLDESTFKQKAKTLADHFQELSAKQFIFLPYNPSGIRMFLAKKGQQMKKINLKWNDVKVPMQIGNVECGYYVMRFMKEIIADQSILCAKFNEKDTYNEDEINEIRSDWTTYVGDLI
ncbi:uncharacterized protein LOC107174498 isoform X3 [Citrus sinensis]|uniref:uncharacterized protein LOC107174498 isoform X3 n=1 Tax=Citrus sinensis TaxID=2711 RepID=UPI0022779950|nr:uncharacterized protein LOC107174498 isoform X3 [Citrus sinensis]